MCDRGEPAKGCGSDMRTKGHLGATVGRFPSISLAATVYATYFRGRSKFVSSLFAVDVVLEFSVFGTMGSVL